LSQPRHLVLAYPGDLEARTGGYVYDRRMALELEARGWRVDRVSLPPNFPFPTRDDLATAASILAAIIPGTTLLVDGLALGAMPDIATGLAERLDLVALVHHPLCLETGLSAERAASLAVSERLALARARGTIVTSPRTAGSLVELFDLRPDTITVAVPGTDPAPVARGSGGRFRMICVATITPRKGHLILIQALARLVDLEWEILCVGSTERDPVAAAALRSAVSAHDLQGRVRLVGELDPSALAALYLDADLCVSASFYEGYGMALAEALARGLPIVAAAGGAVADTVPEAAGLIVPVADAPALGNALRRFLTEPELAASLRRGALLARRDLPGWADTAAGVEAVLLGLAR
jgi:glycosyltransferase involved in cell wall biosynthesis